MVKEFYCPFCGNRLTERKYSTEAVYKQTTYHHHVLDCKECGRFFDFKKFKDGIFTAMIGWL